MWGEEGGVGTTQAVSVWADNIDLPLLMAWLE